MFFVLFPLVFGRCAARTRDQCKNRLSNQAISPKPVLYLCSLFRSSMCLQKYKWYIKENSYCAKMSLESSSKTCFVWLSLHHSNRSIQCSDNYHCKPQIAMICFTSTYLAQFSSTCCCNLVSDNHTFSVTHLKQESIKESRPR